MTKPTKKDISRTCPHCGLEKSLMFFSHLPHDQRCDVCIPTAISRQCVEKQLVQVRKDSNDLATLLTQSAALPRIDQVLVEFIRRYGGLPLFVELMVQDLKELEKSHKGTFSLYDRKMSFLKLIKESTKMLDDRDIADMTDEQLAQERELMKAKIWLEMNQDKVAMELASRTLVAHGLPNDDQMVKEVLSG